MDSRDESVPADASKAVAVLAAFRKKAEEKGEFHASNPGAGAVVTQMAGRLGVTVQSRFRGIQNRGSSFFSVTSPNIMLISSCRTGIALRTRLPATSSPAAYKTFRLRDCDAATTRAGSVSLVAHPQFSGQISVIDAQFCMHAALGVRTPFASTNGEQRGGLG